MIEVVRKEITRPKLTISKTRVTLKVPSKFRDDEVKKLTDFVETIDRGGFDKTYRGGFDDDGVTLYNDAKTDKIRLNF